MTQLNFLKFENVITKQVFITKWVLITKKCLYYKTNCILPLKLVLL